MPYYRRKGYSKNYKRRYRRYGGSRKPKLTTLQAAGFLANKAWSGVKMLKNLINTEFKYIDTQHTFTSPGLGNWEYQVLNLLGTGDTATTRDGNTNRMKSLQLRFQVTGNITIPTTLVRCVALIDIDPDGSTFVPTNLYPATMTSMRDLSNRRDYVILKEWQIQVGTGDYITKVEEFYKQLDLKTVYSGTGAGEAVIDHGKIIFMCMSDQNPGVSPPTIQLQSRVRFLDN